jgi:hypothetical protein
LSQGVRPASGARKALVGRGTGTGSGTDIDWRIINLRFGHK